MLFYVKYLTARTFNSPKIIPDRPNATRTLPSDYFREGKSEGFEYGKVGLVHNGRVKRCQINACRVFRVVPHRLADDGDGNVLALRYGSPGMAGYITGERYGQA